MTLHRFNWIDPQPIPSIINQELEIYPPVLRSILFQRGFTTLKDAQAFLSPEKPAWYPSQQILHIEKSCQISTDAFHKQDRIAIVGDYDADGITSTALLTHSLSKIGCQVIPFIPNRLEDGYGLNKKSLSSLFDQGVKLLITVDNGIRSEEEVAFANSLGMKVIITDHHTPDKNLPPAAAIVNPKLPDDPYPFKDLAGVGIAYKLISALSVSFPEIIPYDYLDLVAIGTIADIVPLVSENRYLVSQGLAVFNKSQRQSLVSLLGAANLLNQKIRSSDISFQIGPRINAPGRMDSAELPLNLLLSDDPHTCGNLAQILENQNFQRKKISSLMESRAEQIIAGVSPFPSILFVVEADFHLGVVGIAAGYLTRNFYAPSVVGNVDHETITASCRSIPEFNIIDALDRCQDLLERYGGHSMAAGFTVSTHNFPELKRRLINLANLSFAGRKLKPSLVIDAEVSLDQLNDSLYSDIEKLEPTGSGNSKVLFITKDLTTSQIKVVGQDGGHLKLSVSDGKYCLDAIGFGLGRLSESIPHRVDLVYKFDINEFRGSRSFQLIIEDLKPA